MALRRLEQNQDYKVLEAIWIHHLTAIEKARDSAAQKGQESAWRYHAGQEKGAKKIVTALQAAILDMESKDQDLKGDEKFELLMSELRGEQK